MILDTNALSALGDADPLIAIALRNIQVVSLPVIVLGEYRFGLPASRYRQQRKVWLENLERRSRILSVDSDTAHVYAIIHRELKTAGTPILTNDLWIAALVRQHDAVLLSRDAHFDHVSGLRRVGW